MAGEAKDPKDLARGVDAALADPPFASTELARLRAELDAAIRADHGAFGDEVEPAIARLEQARMAWESAGGKCVLGHPGCLDTHRCAHSYTEGPCEDCADEAEAGRLRAENAELRAQVERLTRSVDAHMLTLQQWKHDCLAYRDQVERLLGDAAWALQVAERLYYASNPAWAFDASDDESVERMVANVARRRDMVEKERDEARAEADRRTREVEGTFRVQTELRAQVERLTRERDEARDPESFEGMQRVRGDAAVRVLESEGWRWCDIPACNCGSFHRWSDAAPGREQFAAERNRAEAAESKVDAEKARADAAEAKVAGLAAALEGLFRVVERDAIRFAFDWACAECAPASEALVEGFRCRVHAARAALTDAAPILAAHVEAAIAPVRAERDALARVACDLYSGALDHLDGFVLNASELLHFALLAAEKALGMPALAGSTAALDAVRDRERRTAFREALELALTHGASAPFCAAIRRRIEERPGALVPPARQEVHRG